jgi:hypothetical protein
MPLITLRTKSGVSSDSDLTVEVKDNTFEYLMTSHASSIRVSAYLDRNWPEVAKTYAELYLNESCPFESKIASVTPGSRVRKDIQLPAPMQQGEQLVLEVKRAPLDGAASPASDPASTHDE